MGNQKFLNKTVARGVVVSGSPDAGVAGILDTAGDILVVDTRDLTNMTIEAIQVVDAGTAVLLIEATIDDGASWGLVTGGSLTDASFPAGANTGLFLGASDARGMPLQFQQVRARLSAVAGGGSYRLAVSGLQLDGFR